MNANATLQIRIDQHRIRKCDLTPAEINRILLKIRREGRGVLKAKITSSTVGKEKGGGEKS